MLPDRVQFIEERKKKEKEGRDVTEVMFVRID